ncbi:hypothetical protein IP90_01159 [Luteimonas cucumeris]|uniref:Sel1 repeat-containing protein n=1 Tax=Luteimonas cucumeris TaxID=985012 RepID=A0A562LBI0_9GAMM|nr:sel1 repeat family protein [Luteimonas cucumeris]TWI05017.1 hypothetical protein IP90_01159 [Luteimonas cucumeris]
MMKAAIAATGCMLTLVSGWTPATGSESSTQPPPRCSQTVERYFPGDYYFCAGSRAFSKGDYEHALSMYESAAAWGDKRAQFNLGLIHFRGDHIPVNQPLGLAWLALAAERPDAKLEREVLATSYSSVSPEVRRQADALWNMMKSKYGDRMALERARTRFDRETRHIQHLKTSDPFASVAIRGMGHGAGLSRDTGLGYMGPLGSVGGLAKDLEERAATQLDRPDGKVTVGELEVAEDQSAARRPSKKKVGQTNP